MTLLALTADFWIITTFCFWSSFIWLFFAWKQHSGGSYYWKRDQWGRRIEKVFDGKKIPIYKTSMFYMFLVHIAFGTVIFVLGNDYWDLWFQ